jgi:hypothetical protein
MVLTEIVTDFASGLKAADALRPQAVSQRSGRQYQAGIGPHPENAAVALILSQMRLIRPGAYDSAGPVRYPNGRLACDLGVGDPLAWAIEIKMARAFGDNGKLDDTYLKDLLSPYDGDHSALSDATKLRQSEFKARKAVMVYGFDYPTRPLEQAFEALELLLTASGLMGARAQVAFTELVHPVHSTGRVAAWEVLNPAAQDEPASAGAIRYLDITKIS